MYETQEISSIAVPFVPLPPPPISKLSPNEAKPAIADNTETAASLKQMPLLPASKPVTAQGTSNETRTSMLPETAAPFHELSLSKPDAVPSIDSNPASTSDHIASNQPPIYAAPTLPTHFEEYDPVQAAKESTTQLRAAKVPSSRLGRLFHYGGLASGLALGAASSLVRSPSSSSPNSLFMSEANVARLVDKLSTMRGAALKLGQFLSIQETKLLPPQIEKVLLRVQNSANYMPVWQMNQVMISELGSNWRDNFTEFDDVPFASASIGQVHSAVLSQHFADQSMAGKSVAVKVQFPGVLESIDSDLSYLRWLVSASALLPRGLFLENTLRVLGRELRDECDYAREAEMGRRFRAVLSDSHEFEVPKVIDTLSTAKVLTTQMMRGRPLSQAASRYDQNTRNRIAGSILNLSLSELFSFRLMQTDPNWSNFLYNERDGKIQLIDFGATREYSKEFMDMWMQMLQAAISSDYSECLKWSQKVGYLTGEESKEMEKAHVDSMIALGEPFRKDAPNPYPFESQTITDRVKEQIPLMLRERLTPPPEETYSLNRKLSGAFLLCARLKAEIGCRVLWERVERDYKLGFVEEGVLEKDGSIGQKKGPFSAPEQRRTFYTAFQTLREERRHGRNLADRFPRSKVVLCSSNDSRSTGSEIVGDTVESLSPTPVGSTSIQETPLNSTSAEPTSKIEVTRSATPAEVKPAVSSTIACAARTFMGPTIIRGITIPLKPPPPGPEECCMSGCAHCAYDIYAEDLEDFHARLSSVRSQLSQLEPRVTNHEWRSDLLGEYPGETEIKGKEAGEDLKQKAQAEVDKVIGDLDPTMRAFLEMERKLKKVEREKANQGAQTW
nr:related to ABC1-ubiquinol--cytochrome-c reductase complex assembly protein [Melanopsichium pennsylvanicum 4]